MSSGCELLNGILGKAFLILRRDHFADNLCGGLDDEINHLLLYLGNHLVSLLNDALLSLDDDAFGILDRLLELLLCNCIATGARLLQEFGCVLVRLAQDFLVAQFGFRQLLLDPFGVVLAFFDSAPPLLEHLENGSKGILVKDPINYEKQDDLRDELRPSDPEVRENLCDNVHFRRMLRPPAPGEAGGLMSLTALESENQRINRDGFSKSHSEDAER